MYLTSRYLVIGAAFIVLCLVTVEHATMRIEAETQRQANTVVSGVEHMFVAVDGRHVELHGRIRATQPSKLSGAVSELIDAVNHLPAVETINAQVEIRDRDKKPVTETMLIRS